MAKRRQIRSLATFLVLSVAGLSVLPTQENFALHTQGRLHPLLHLLTFGVLTFLFLAAIRSWQVKGLAIAGMLTLDFGTEYAEHLLNTWPVEWKDVLLNSTGILAGVAAAVVYSRTRRR